MPRHLTVDADLEFAVDVPGAPPVHGHADRRGQRTSSSGSSDPFLFAGRGDAGAVRGLADGARPAAGSRSPWSPRPGPLVTLGVAAHLLAAAPGHRVAAHPGRARCRAVVAGPRPGAALPPARALPASDARAAGHAAARSRRRFRGGRAPGSPPRTIRAGGGNPRLIMAPRADPWPGDRPGGVPAARRRHHDRQRPGCDIGCRASSRCTPRSGTTSDDEFVAGPAAAAPATPGSTARPSTTPSCAPRTRLQLGDWTMSFYREEYADHGRPYGGRVGGEIGHQRPQPARRRRSRREWTGVSVR